MKLTNISTLLFLIIILFAGCRGTKGGSAAVVKDGVLQLSKAHKIVFANKAAGEAQIVKDDVEDYFGRIKKLDMQIQMNSSSRGDRNTLLKDYKQHLKKSVMDWKPEEEQFVANVIKKAYELVSLVSPKVFPDEIIMIKNNMNHYGEGVFYTREKAIVIPMNTLEMKDSADFLKTMIHEVFHIYARYNTDKRDKLYAKIGYTKIDPPTIPDILNRRVLLNPDGVDYNYGIRVKRKTTGQEILAMPIIFSKMLNFQPDKTDFFEYLQFYLFEVSNGEVQVTRNGDSTVRIKNITEFYEQIGTNTQYIIHPDEVLADNFVLMSLSVKDEAVLKDFNIRPAGKKLINDLKEIIKN